MEEEELLILSYAAMISFCRFFQELLVFCHLLRVGE
jgi:hypothetical protein